MKDRKVQSRGTGARGKDDHVVFPVEREGTGLAEEERKRWAAAQS